MVEMHDRGQRLNRGDAQNRHQSDKKRFFIKSSPAVVRFEFARHSEYQWINQAPRNEQDSEHTRDQIGSPPPEQRVLPQVYEIGDQREADHGRNQHEKVQQNPSYDKRRNQPDAEWTSLIQILGVLPQ